LAAACRISSDRLFAFRGPLNRSLPLHLGNSPATSWYCGPLTSDHFTIWPGSSENLTAMIGFRYGRQFRAVM
jgi:hypothetical protein